MGRLCVQVQNNSYPGNFGYVFDINRKLSDKMHTKLNAMVTLGKSLLFFGLLFLWHLIISITNIFKA